MRVGDLLRTRSFTLAVLSHVSAFAECTREEVDAISRVVGLREYSAGAVVLEQAGQQLRLSHCRRPEHWVPPTLLAHQRQHPVL